MDNENANISTEQLMVTLPANLLAQIDARIGGAFVDREEFIRAAVRHYLEYLQTAGGAPPSAAV